MRLMSSLCPGWPGTIASGWPGRFLKADSSRSSRRPALRISGSGPWQLKQLAARMGCTSWLKSRCWRGWAELWSDDLWWQPEVAIRRERITQRDGADTVRAALEGDLNDAIAKTD